VGQEEGLWDRRWGCGSGGGAVGQEVGLWVTSVTVYLPVDTGDGLTSQRLEAGAEGAGR